MGWNNGSKNQCDTESRRANADAADADLLRDETSENEFQARDIGAQEHGTAEGGPAVDGAVPVQQQLQLFRKTEPMPAIMVKHQINIQRII